MKDRDKNYYQYEEYYWINQFRLGFEIFSVLEPLAMMIKVHNALITHWTMLWLWPYSHLANVTKLIFNHMMVFAAIERAHLSRWLSAISGVGTSYKDIVIRRIAGDAHHMNDDMKQKYDRIECACDCSRQYCWQTWHHDRKIAYGKKYQKHPCD